MASEAEQMASQAHQMVSDQMVSEQIASEQMTSEAEQLMSEAEQMMSGAEQTTLTAEEDCKIEPGRHILVLDNDLVELWAKVGSKLSLTTDAEISRYLLALYFGVVSPDGVEHGPRCDRCNCPLALLCANCNIFQQDPSLLQTHTAPQSTPKPRAKSSRKGASSTGTRSRPLDSSGASASLSLSSLPVTFQDAPLSDDDCNDASDMGYMDDDTDVETTHTASTTSPPQVVKAAPVSAKGRKRVRDLTVSLSRCKPSSSVAAVSKSPKGKPGYGRVRKKTWLWPWEKRKLQNQDASQTEQVQDQNQDQDQNQKQDKGDDKIDKPPDTPVTCPDCKKVFKTKITLKRHSTRSSICQAARRKRLQALAQAKKKKEQTGDASGKEQENQKMEIPAVTADNCLESLDMSCEDGVATDVLPTTPNQPHHSKATGSETLQSEHSCSSVGNADLDNENNRRRHLCPECGKRYTSLNSLTKHIRSHHHKLGGFTCKFCYRHYVEFSALRTHLNHVHLKIKPFACETCGKTFADKRSALPTRHSCTIKSAIVPTCDQCGKQYNSMKNLREHMHMHSSNLRFRCEICLKRFLFRAQLYRHRKKCLAISQAPAADLPSESVPLPLGPKPYACEKCGKKFVLKRSVKKSRHVCKIKEKKIVPVCEHCGKQYVSLKYLREHMHMHTQNQRYRCEICLKRFLHRAQMYRHNKKCVAPAPPPTGDVPSEQINE